VDSKKLGGGLQQSQNHVTWCSLLNDAETPVNHLEHYERVEKAKKSVKAQKRALTLNSPIIMLMLSHRMLSLSVDISALLQ
jgi:hypothetical protein